MEKLTQKQAKAIKLAVKEERTVDQYYECCIRDEKGRYYPIDDIDSWVRFLGKPVAVTGKPQLFVVQLDRDDDTAEKIDDWDGLDAFKELVDQQVDLDPDENPDRFAVFPVGWDVGPDGKPGETTIFSAAEAAALDNRIMAE